MTTKKTEKPEEKPVEKTEEPEEKPVEIIETEEPPKGRVERKLDVLSERLDDIEKGLSNFQFFGKKTLPDNILENPDNTGDLKGGRKPDIDRYPRFKF